MNATATGRIDSVTIESEDPTATERFVREASGLDDRIHVRASDDPTSGFRGFSLSLVFAQPADVDSAAGAAEQAGASVIKPVQKSLWGYGGSYRAPDGTVWTIASSSKKNSGAATGKVEHLVLLAGVENVGATKEFYSGRGLPVGRSFGSKYVEFDTGPLVTLAIQSRRAVAKNAGVDPDGTGSHRLILSSALGPFVDPDGYVWE